MKQKFSEVAHLYIGCKLVSKQTNDIVSVLEGVVNGVAHYRISGVWYSAPLSGFKPMLRLLSSAESDEMKKIRRLMISYDNLSFTHEQMHNRNFGTGRSFYYSEYDEEGHFICAVSSPIENLPLKAIPYLLSKHFDLFGLIESSEAITNQ